MLVAKKRARLLALHAAMREGRVDKRYPVLVRGKWRDAKRQVELPLTRFLTSDGERRVRVEQTGGQHARTVFYRRESLARRRPRRSACSKPSSTPAARTRSASISRTWVSRWRAMTSTATSRGTRRSRRQGLKRMFLHAVAPRPAASARAARRLHSSRRCRPISPTSSRGSKLRASSDDAVSRQRRFRLLVFDWDGTLADSTALIAGALQQTCRETWASPVPDDVSGGTSSGSAIATRSAIVAPTLPTSATTGDSPSVSASHYLVGDAGIPLFDGVRDMLDELRQRGFLLGVATGKSRARARPRARPARHRAPLRRVALRRREAFPSRTRTCCCR